MPKEYNRTERVAEFIQREMAQLLLQEAPNLALGLVTVTRVTVSRDLAYAKIYITQHESEQAVIEATVKVLNRSVKHFRYLLAQVTKLRITPHLRFFYDATLIQSAHLSALIDEAVAMDEKKIKNKNSE